VRDVTPDVVLAWQRRVLKAGGVKHGQALAPNTVRLAPLATVRGDEAGGVHGPRCRQPYRRRSQTPRDDSPTLVPEPAREFLALIEGDRLSPLGAFLLSSGLRIGELVWLRPPDAHRAPAAVFEYIEGWYNTRTLHSSLGYRSSSC
jgi:hypothetical protein